MQTRLLKQWQMCQTEHLWLQWHSIRRRLLWKPWVQHHHHQCPSSELSSWFQLFESGFELIYSIWMNTLHIHTPQLFANPHVNKVLAFLQINVIATLDGEARPATTVSIFLLSFYSFLLHAAINQFRLSHLVGHKIFWPKEKMNKAGYTATSCGRVGRGGNAHFPTFRLDHYGPTDGPTDGRTDRRTDGPTDRRTKPLIELRVRN